jgi:hypothetical protein
MATEQVKIGAEYHDIATRNAKRIGMGTAEYARRAIDLYGAVTRHPAFWMMVEILNGRKLAEVMTQLLVMWVEGKVTLPGDAVTDSNQK